jgi:hypothetical protein
VICGIGLAVAGDHALRFWCAIAAFAAVVALGFLRFGARYRALH